METVKIVFKTIANAIGLAFIAAMIGLFAKTGGATGLLLILAILFTSFNLGGQLGQYLERKKHE